MQKENSFQVPRIILISAFLLAFAIAVSQHCVPPMEHIIRAEFHITHTQTGFIFTIPIIMTAALSIPAGILTDRLGIRKAAGLGLILMVIGAVLRGMTTDYFELVAFTFILGVGSACILPNLAKLVSLWVPREKAGIATGIYAIGISVGGGIAIAITLPLVYPVTSTSQGAFLIWSIPIIIATVVWWLFIKDPPYLDRFDETIKQDGISFLQIIKTKVLWLVAISLFLRNFFYFNWVAWAPALMMEKGAPENMAAVIASLILWFTIPGFLLAPWLSNKIGLRKPFVWLPSIILALASLWAIYIDVPMSWLLMILVGIMDGTKYVMLLALPIEIMPKETVGRASGLIISIGFTGGIIGPLIGGYTLDFTGNLNLSLLILLGLSILAIGIALKLPETGPRTSLKR
ncbi:CynX/NimT family MFS transporter [Chloroflexota bacterium]